MRESAKYVIEKLSDKNFELVECRAERIKGLIARFTEEGPKDLSYLEDEGLSIRGLKNGYWYFTIITNPSKAVLKEKLDDSKFDFKITAKNGIKIREVDIHKDEIEIKAKQTLLNLNPDDISEIPLDAYNNLNSLINEKADYIKSFDISFNSAFREEIFVNNEGTEITQTYPFQRMAVSLTGLENGKRARSVETIGGPRGIEAFKEYENWNVNDLLNRLVTRIRTILNGIEPPKGDMPVVMDPSMTGTLIHEAFGHLCEADLVFAGGAITPQHIGKTIANEKVTIIDDPINLDGGWVPYDNEGVKSQKATLVDKGILKEFMVNREYAHILGQEPKGNARATNYHYHPIIRMRNTYLKQGDHSFKELVEDIKSGIYVEKFIGGQASLLGTFQFSCQVGWLIENGEITKPLRDISISGSTFETLQKLDAIGENFETDIGTCGKGQWVIVGDGGPSVRIPRLRVGGI
jgi:TldD protein